MSLADIVLKVSQERSSDDTQAGVADIIEFVESSWGLGTKLYPVQRIILKAFYGIPLDDTNPNIRISDWQQEVWENLTEAGYLRKLFKEGRSNVEEIIPGKQYTELVLSIGRRSGKCVLGDTLVLTDRGVRRIDTLGDPQGSEVQPLDVQVSQEGKQKAFSRYFYNGGVKATRTFTTHCGYRLGGTPNHRIKVLSQQGLVEWRHLEDLRVGDVVCLHRGTNLWAKEPVDLRPYHNALGRKELAFPDVLDARWGLLLGYLVGDGLWNYRDRTEVTVEHDETWERLKQLYTELLGGFTVALDKRTENTGAVKFASVGMRQFLHDLGYEMGTERDAKMVPWSVMQSPRPVVQAFLRGLFETDGGVEADGKVVSFSTASYRLAHEVQTLLLNLGIVSRVKPKTVKAKTYWILCVRGLRSRLAFAEYVGFDSRKKKEPLCAALKDVTREGGDTESIPRQRGWAQRLLQSVPKVKPDPTKKQDWRRTKLREVLGNILKPGCVEDLTYSRLQSTLLVAKALGADPEILAHFEHLLGLDYFYDEVEEITEGEHSVFDLHVPDGESFVANGFTNHNTFMSACCVAYEVYKLISKGTPQKYYGLKDTSEIGIVSVATATPQAGLLFNEAAGHFAKCAFFSPYTASSTLSHIKFQTANDIELFGRYKDDQTAKATIKVTFASCIAKGLRGPGNMMIILDELAHFNDVGQSDAKNVYDAITPSVATFSPKDPDDSTKPIGDVEGRKISISSPLGRQGFFFNLFQLGFRGGKASAGKLCIQAPTWEVNPTLPANYYASEYASDPAKFFTEFGAEFTNSTRGWLEREGSDLLVCVDPRARPKMQATPRVPHFAGIDLGLVNDGTAVAIGHLDDKQRIVLDFLEVIKAGEGKYVDSERLEFDEVAEWVYQLSRKFFIAEGFFDQWSGIPFEQALIKKGLRQFHSEHMTKNKNSDIYRNFKDMIWDQRLVLYDFPIEEGQEHCAYIQELMDLQATYHSRYITEVEAPPGKHDDRSDALARMIWLASQNLGKAAYIVKGSNRGALDQTLKGPIIAQRGRKTSRTGSSPDRQIRTMNRRRI